MVFLEGGVKMLSLAVNGCEGEGELYPGAQGPAKLVILTPPLGTPPSVMLHYQDSAAVIDQLQVHMKWFLGFSGRGVLA